METIIHDNKVMLVSKLNLSVDEKSLSISVFRDDRSLESFHINFDFSGKIIELWTVQLGIVFKVQGELLLCLPDSSESLCKKAVEIAMRSKQFAYYLEHTGQMPKSSIE